jgi:hypothetical protein
LPYRTHDVLYGFIARLPFSSLKKNSPTSRHKKLLKENTLIKKDVSSLKQKNIKLSKGVNKAKQLIFFKLENGNLAMNP